MSQIPTTALLLRVSRALMKERGDHEATQASWHAEREQRAYVQDRCWDLHILAGKRKKLLREARSTCERLRSLVVELRYDL